MRGKGFVLKEELKCMQQMWGPPTYTRTHARAKEGDTPVITVVSTDPGVVSAYVASKTNTAMQMKL